MRYRANGGVLGPVVTTNTAFASGMWSTPEFYQKLRAGTWPTDQTSTYLADPNFEYVTLLLKSVGANTAQNYTFLDSSASNLSVTRYADVTQGAFSPHSVADGYWSNYFDGVGDYITVPSNAAFAFGTGDFTMEAWIYQTQRNTLSDICSMHNYGVGADMLWSINSSGNLHFQISSSATGAQISSSTVPLNTWTHVAVIRINGLVKQYINGVETSSGAYATSISSTISFSIGSPANGNSSGTFYGYISNVRVVKGTAVYTSAFTPSTIPLTSISGTSYLTCQSNRFKDNSTNNFTITCNGDTKITAFGPFNPSSAYSASGTGGSLYFDGSGDYLSSSYSTSDMDWFSTDYTLEAWVYIPGSTYGWAYNSSGEIPGLIGNYQLLSSTVYWSFGPITDGTVRLYYWNGAQNRVTSTATILVNQWNHIAFTKTSSGITIFVNGVASTTTAVSGTPQSSSSVPLMVGRTSSTDMIKGYVSGLRIVKGTALYSGNFTPPTEPLTAITNTKYLLNGTNASIIDASRKNTIYTYGNSQTRTNIFKFNKSTYFSGSSDYLVTLLNDTLQFGTGNFTVECWTYLVSRVTNQPCIFSNYNNYTTSSLSLFAGHGGASTSAYQVAINGGSFPVIQGGTITYNQWVHLAVVRSESTITLYVNGTSVGTASSSASLNGVGSLFYIGTSGDNIAACYLNGYVEDFRVSKGHARYTTNFTPPVAEFNTL